MPVIRLFLLLVVLGGLTLLLLQNWSPVLPLVFLGLQTQALPLAVWILLSIAAGATTSLFITSLFKVANLFSRSSSNKNKKVAASPRSRPPRTSTQRSEPIYTSPTTSRPSPPPVSIPSDAADDWGSNSSSNDDWGFEEDTEKRRNDNFADDVNSRSYEVGSEPQDNVNSRSYEVSSEPKSSARTGSVYSYSYRESSNSGVGKTESVYDADYRVITPPRRQPDTVDDDDDWGFDDDDDVEDSDRDSDPKWR